MNNLFGEKDTPLVLFQLSRKLDSAKSDYDSLLAELKMLYGQYAEYPEYHALKSTLHQLMGQKQKAIESISVSIRMHQHNATYYHKRADIFFRMGSFEDALDDYEIIIKQTDMIHRDYFLSDSMQMSLLVYSCIGAWDKAEKLAGSMDDDYVFFTEPISGKITRTRVLQAIQQQNRNWFRENERE